MPQPLHVLLVEDNLQDAELVLRELRHAGFDPVWKRVDTEEDYLAQLDTDYDVILSDYQLPQFNGLRALELLNESGRKIPFIIISGTIGEDTAVEAMKQGAADYLLKDRLIRLGLAIHHALEEERLRREREMATEMLHLREQALGEVSQGVLICDENRLVIYANPSFTSITGYSQGEIMGRNCAILQGPDTDPATIQKIRSALKAEQPFEGRILNYRKDGTAFWNDLSLSPMHDAKNGPQRFIGIQRDVTKRKLAEDTLQQSEERIRRERALLRALIDSIPDLIFFKDRESVFLGCNKALEKHLGIPEEKLIGLTDYDIVPRELAESYRNKDLELFVSGKALYAEDWIPTKDGEGGFFETVKTPYYGPDGESLGLIGISRDITERKKAEAALQESQLRHRSLFENMLEGYSYCRLLYEEGRVRDFVYLEINPSFEVLTGLKNVIGKKVSELIPGIHKTNPEILEIYSRVAQTGKPEKHEVYLKSLGIWISLSVYSHEKEHFVAVFDNITERKAGELKIRFNEQRYRSLVEATTSIVWDMPASGEFESEQPSWSAFTGQSVEELRGWGWLDAIHPDDQAETARVWSAALATQRIYEVEYRLRAADQTYRHMMARAVPILAEDGKILQWIGVDTDITEKKLAEAARDRMVAILESTTDFVSIRDPAGHILYLNGAGRNLLGIGTHEDLADISLIDFLPNPGSHPMLNEGIPTAIRKGTWSGESALLSRSGKEIPISQVILAHKSPDGEVEYLSTIARDITERQQAQRALGLALERLQLAIQAGKAGVWDINLLTGEVAWDEQMLALYGKNAGNVEAGVDRWFFAMHPDDLARARAFYEEKLQGATDSFDLEFRMHRADDGSLHFMRSSGIVVRDVAGKAVGMTGLNWDITEERNREGKLSEALALEKELRREAQAGNRAKNEFLAVMSHEIRTPMNGILGFSELLAGTPDLPDDCKDYVKTISSSGEALLRILDDILDFSRMEAGGLQIENSLFSSHEIVQNVHALLAPSAIEKNLEFHLAIEADVPEQLWNDAGRLRQLLLNLVGNAIKFTEHGTITFGMRSSSELSKNGKPAVDFFIRDTGVGMREEDLGHIFEPFVQADSSVSRRYGGTGLGLAISQNLVKLMGGKLTVQSKVGSGSEFHVILPVGVPEGAMAPVPKSDAEAMDKTFAANHPLGILLVEDDRVNLKLLCMILRKLGYEPFVAEDGVKAVEIYTREHPDCILMDLQMPRKDGFQATLEIRAMENGGPRPYISALTANIVAEDRRQCFAVGMDGYMNKPINHPMLVKTLKQASDRKKSPSDVATVQKW